MATTEHDTRLLLYAILGSPVSVAELPGGVQQRPLTLMPIASAGLWAVVSPLPDPGRLQAPAANDALDYDQALHALHARTTVLPLRYGTILNSAEEVVTLLSTQAAVYREQLARLYDCDEFGIRALNPAAAPPEPAAPSEPPPPVATGAAGGGTAFLRARQSRYQREQTAAAQAELLAGRLGTALGHLAVAQLAQFRASPAARQMTPTLSVSFLVPRAQQAAFRRAFAAFNGQQTQALRLFGPFPPYSFAAPQPVSPPIATQVL